MIRRPHRVTFRLSDKELQRCNRVRNSRELFYKDWSKFVMFALERLCTEMEAKYPQLAHPPQSDAAHKAVEKTVPKKQRRR